MLKNNVWSVSVSQKLLHIVPAKQTKNLTFSIISLYPCSDPRKCRSHRMSRGCKEEIESRGREKEQTSMISSSLMTFDVIYMPMTLKLIAPTLKHSWTLLAYWKSHWTPPRYRCLRVNMSKTEHLITPKELIYLQTLWWSWWQLHPSNCSDQNLGVLLDFFLSPHGILIFGQKILWNLTLKHIYGIWPFLTTSLLPVWLELASSFTWRCPELQTDLLLLYLPLSLASSISK